MKPEPKKTALDKLAEDLARMNPFVVIFCVAVAMTATGYIAHLYMLRTGSYKKSEPAIQNEKWIEPVLDRTPDNNTTDLPTATSSGGYVNIQVPIKVTMGGNTVPRGWATNNVRVPAKPGVGY